MLEKKGADALKPVAGDFNLPSHSHHEMTIFDLNLQHGNTESRENLEQKFKIHVLTGCWGAVLAQW